MIGEFETLPVRSVLAVGAPSAGTVACTRLAVAAAESLQWLRTLLGDPGPAVVAESLDAVGTLRTALRSLRPILDKDWSVQMRGRLAPVAAVLADLHQLDVGRQLCGDTGTSTDTGPGTVAGLLGELRSRRLQLVDRLPAAVEIADLTALADLARSDPPAPLRTGAPIGDPGLPAPVLLAPMLHRRWRKLSRETPADDLDAVARRAAELLMMIETGERFGLSSRRLRTAAELVHATAVEALQARTAAELVGLMPLCAARVRLRRGVVAGRRAERDLRQQLATLGRLGAAVPAGRGGPAKQAAGGLVLRLRGGHTELLLVHRCRQDDWSLPKGAVQPGETAAEAALREVREETGLRCRLGAELTPSEYRDRNNRAKRVRYWHMTPIVRVGRPDPTEVDGMRWVQVAEAPALLSRRRDRAVVAAFLREYHNQAEVA